MHIEFVPTYVIQDNHGLGPSTIVVADGVENTIVVELGNKLLNKQDQEDTADSGEVEVVDEEERLELEWLTIAHQLTATKDDHVVDDDEDGGRLEGRHGSLKGDKFELLGGIANNDLPGLAENRP